MVPSISPPALGLTADSSNEDILRAAFDFAHSIGYMTFATTAVDGKTPTIRALEVHYLDDSGSLYVGASRGKHFYDEVELHPVVSAMAVNVVAVRVTARLEKVSDKLLYERYWELNQGTKKMLHIELRKFEI